jgi:type III restriction enzyme
VASDFSLIDAIEAGIVKVPRVPVSDDSMTGDLPTYRDLWLRIAIICRRAQTDDVGGEPKLLRACKVLHSLYSNLRSTTAGAERRARARGITRQSSSSSATPTSPRLSSTTLPVGKSVAASSQEGMGGRPCHKLSCSPGNCRFRNDDAGTGSAAQTILVDSQPRIRRRDER